jgi:RHS repeat-associated protein
VRTDTCTAYQYDGNGNLTNDGLRSFAYDDENQLIQVWVPNQWYSQFTYDGKMRRRIRQEYTWQGSAWVQTNEVYYVYDGNEVIQERNINNLPTTTYTRGKDLSGSLEAAGGIGGLLSMTLDTQPGPASSNSMYYHSDGNGNVTMLINASQYVVAKYIYDAFGNILSKSGLLADANLYRFSSKEAHLNSGLVYYLYRHYDPNLQRWPNRDPIAEEGSEILWSGLQLLAPPGELREDDAVDYVDTDGRGPWGGFKNNVLNPTGNFLKNSWGKLTIAVGVCTLAVPIYVACQSGTASVSGWNNYNTTLTVLESKYANPSDWPPGMQQYMQQWNLALIKQYGQFIKDCFSATPNPMSGGPSPTKL